MQNYTESADGDVALTAKFLFSSEIKVFSAHVLLERKKISL